jgi:hypothetical protein
LITHIIKSVIADGQEKMDQVEEGGNTGKRGGEMREENKERFRDLSAPMS